MYLEGDIGDSITITLSPYNISVTFPMDTSKTFSIIINKWFNQKTKIRRSWLP